MASYHGPGTCTFYRYRQYQPAMLIEFHGPAPARTILRKPRTAAARCADRGRQPTQPPRSTRHCRQMLYVPSAMCWTTRAFVNTGIVGADGDGRIDQSCAVICSAMGPRPQCAACASEDFAICQPHSRGISAGRCCQRVLSNGLWPDVNPFHAGTGRSGLQRIGRICWRSAASRSNDPWRARGWSR